MPRTRTAHLRAAVVFVSIAFAGLFPTSQALAQSETAAPECFESARLSGSETLEVSLHQDASNLKNIALVGGANWIAKHTTQGHYPLGARMILVSPVLSTLSTNFASLVGTGPVRAKPKLFNTVAA